MGMRSTVIYTTGAAGSGKSYVRCPVFLLTEFLPDRAGVHWSNFPIGRVPDDHTQPPNYEGELFAERIARWHTRKDESQYEATLARLKMIPAEVMKSWERGESGPWDFFAQTDLAGAHIAIDEIHNFCGRHTKANIRQQWQAWLGEIRHRGATVEFLTQSPNKVAKEIAWESAVRVQLVSGDDRRDPILSIPMGDWYELRAAWLTGKYVTPIVAAEQRQVFGYFRRSHVRKFPRDPFYYQFYDSFNAPQQGGKAGQLEKKEFEKRGKLGVTRWFVLRNLWPLSKAVGIVLIFAFIFSGQAPKVLTWGIVTFISMAQGSPVDQPAEHDAAPQPQIAGTLPASNDVQVDDRVGEPLTLVADDVQLATSDVQRLRTEHAAMQADLDRRQAELDEAHQEIEEAAKQLEDLRQTIGDATALVLLTQDTVTFRGGYTYATGEVIDFGPYTGNTIESINFRRRYAVLDSGDVLRLGDAVQLHAPARTDTDSSVQPAVSGTASDGDAE